MSDHYIVVKPVCNGKIITLQFPKSDVSKNLVFKRRERSCPIKFLRKVFIKTNLPSIRSFYISNYFIFFQKLSSRSSHSCTKLLLLK